MNEKCRGAAMESHDHPDLGIPGLTPANSD
jgi:hypothetical protein